MNLSRLKRRFTVMSGVVACGLTLFKSQAMTFQLLHGFDSPAEGPWSGLIQGPDGNFYGVTDSGGLGYNGSVYRVDSTGAVKVIHYMQGNDGSGPEGRLALGTNGWMYGTTYFGGPADAGTIFKVNTNGDFVTLGYFAATNGIRPETGLTLAGDGNFYGTTYYGGTNDQGAVYRVSHAGGVQLVASFWGPNGVNPGWNAILCAASDGNLYGTTRLGGAYGSGVIFKVTTSGTVTTLVNFGGPLSPQNPLTGLCQGSDGSLYGTTTRGGDYNLGAVFKADLLGNLTQIGSFDGTNAYEPQSTLIQASDGNFYTDTYSQLVRITPAGDITTLYNFAEDFGSDVECTLVQGSDGYLYGTTYNGGMGDRGVIFKSTLGGNVQRFAQFSNPGGGGPEGLMVRGADGNIYGACAGDGNYGGGTVYRVSPSGQFTNIYHFDNTNGGYPTSLINAQDGSFYGTAGSGGLWGGGTVFQITTNGLLTTLGNLDGTNGSKPWSVLRGSDGNFYGDAQFGGPSGSGAVFKLDTNGIISSLYGATPGSGNYPSGVVQGNDGYLYGVAFNGPLQGGVVWRLSTSGSYSIFHVFDSATGYYPAQMLTQDPQGLMYGAIFGQSQQLFCLSTNGSITNFGSIPDYGPYGLVVGPDGNFYGMSTWGSPGGAGSLWVMNRNGRVARLVSFDNTNGASPRSLPLLAGDGHIYGCAGNGGPGGGGVIFSLSLTSPEIVGQPVSQSIFPSGSASFDVVVFSTNSISYQWRRNGVDIPGATNLVCTVANANGNDFADYSVAITSGGTTVVSSNATLALLPDRPVLSIERQSANVLLSWLGAYTGFTVEQSIVVPGGSWSTVSQTISSNSGVFSVTIPLGPAPTFYRLKR